MTKTEILVAAAALAFAIPYVATKGDVRETVTMYPEYNQTPPVTDPAQRELSNVLTKPRYQDVPALNRPMMLRSSCYSDQGCSE